ncbi:c-type cytochrome [Allopusillimonas ginsengisoli]|uniref:c-type cytochrome n=1 Tax=Allopusillimonas ginsengisoli TaxID=453575 RepID=UPI0010C1674C|nr:c-type cytochrome [Allopusillimonas ginsengisoli]
MKLTSMHTVQTALALSVLSLACTAAAQSKPAAPEGGTPVAPAKAGNKSFTPPPATSIPDDEFGQMVKKGQDIFLRTGQYAKDYVGNSLNCVSCHLDAGRRPDASPLWGAYVLYPAYRSKNGHVNTLAERLQGCFQYSMNGMAPPADSETIVALESYMFWMAQQAPTGVKLEGQGYPRLAKPAQEPEYVRGQDVFEQNCALCHGANGEGQSAEGKMVFPALWGDESFNWGAGMHSVSTAAAFIKANMPLGKGGTLTDQEAWDVAFYMNSHERPQDPRFNGSLEETRKKYHDSPSDRYGQTVNDQVLGENSTPSGGGLREKG